MVLQVYPQILKYHDSVEMVTSAAFSNTRITQLSNQLPSLSLLRRTSVWGHNLAGNGAHDRRMSRKPRYSYFRRGPVTHSDVRLSYLSNVATHVGEDNPSEFFLMIIKFIHNHGFFPRRCLRVKRYRAVIHKVRCGVGQNRDRHEICTVSLHSTREHHQKALTLRSATWRTRRCDASYYLVDSGLNNSYADSRMEESVYV
jgi:hypothetical protein